MRITTLSKLKKGEYFKLAVQLSGKVYQYDGRFAGRFGYHPHDDINAMKYTKSDLHVNIDFTF
jgi:hypothetical protein